MYRRIGVLTTVALVVAIAAVGLAFASGGATPTEAPTDAPSASTSYVGDAAASEGIPPYMGVVAESIERPSALDSSAAIAAAAAAAPASSIAGSIDEATDVSARLVSYTNNQERGGVTDAGEDLKDLPCWMVVFHNVMMYDHGGGYVEGNPEGAPPVAYPAELVVFVDADTGAYVRMMAYPQAWSTSRDS